MATERTRPLFTHRQYLIQAAVLALAVVMIWGAIWSAQKNLAELGISSGFAFLDRSTGWSYSFSLIERSIDDSYLKTLTIGFMNTLFLGAVSIVLATIIGFIVGTARDSRNLALRSASAVFIQLFRNIPLILQLVFWYAVLIHMPGPRQAISVFDTVFISNRGMMMPTLNVSGFIALLIAAFAIAIAYGVAKHLKSGPGRKFGVWLGLTVVMMALMAIMFSPEGQSAVSFPALKGLRFVGGLPVSIELIAMIVGIVLYGSAYIAEVVRGGLQEVPKGLVEAGQAVGLSPRAIWSRIKVPMALRTIVPPLGNQWIFLMKATTIGVAIGFSDLFMLVSTSITQSGQTLELIGILMGSFLLINFTLAQAINLLNARLQLKGH